MSDQFHTQNFASRWQKMDDEARSVFDAVWKKPYIAWGLDRAPINIKKWPAKWRNAPDVGDSDGLIEIQGFGKDRLLKIKDVKRIALAQWSAEGPVRFFCWDSWAKRWFIAPWGEVDKLLDYPHVVSAFHDGPRYGALHADQLAEMTWHPHDPTATRDTS